jgi:hypothetical protein
MPQMATAFHYTPVALPEIADEDLARHSTARLLISASAQAWQRFSPVAFTTQARGWPPLRLMPPWTYPSRH